MSGTIKQIEDLISQGRYAEARGLAEEALKTSDSLRCRQLFALAVSKSGAPRMAMEYLEPIHRDHPEDAETAGILGSIYKEIFKKDQSTAFAIRSRDTYLKNFSATRNYYTGINAATMSVLAGQSSKGKEIAREVITMLNSGTEDFWERATLAEAYLLCGEREKAISSYITAGKMAATDWGKINSAYNQLWLLNHYVPVPTEVLKVFSPPGVVSFVGHMIDHPDRSQPRFPVTIEGRIKEAIAGAIRTMDARIGYSSLACGSDILFAEAMAENGGEVNIWLPFAKEDFVDVSVRFAGEGWVNRFNALTDRFPVSYLTRGPYAGYDDLFSFQNRVVLGSAIIRSAINHTKPSLLTVLSETDLKKKEGGTRETVLTWPYQDRHININPDRLLQRDAVNPGGTIESKKISKDIDRPVVYLVCASLQGQPAKEPYAWQELYDKLELSFLKPVALETGELLLAAFSSIVGAIELSTALQKTCKSLRLDSRLTISLYANPVYLETIEGQRKFAAESRRRIEDLHAKIPPGGLYAFARFSSVLALDVNHYTLDYAGVLNAEGETGPLEIYRVQPNTRPK